MTVLDLDKDMTSADAAALETAEPDAAPEIRQEAAGTGDNGKILRFYRSERLLHWAIAVPFLVCYTTAMILVVFYNPEPHRPYRLLFSWMHRTSGVCLMVLPLLAVYRSRGDFRVHFYNIKQAWTWVFDDFKWLTLMMAASINTKIKLPDQGKFNAAEKLNFMVLMGTYPLYIATGLFIWLTHVAFVSWLMHTAMALMATPLILGHMYMAIVSSNGRPGLTGMKNGYVDRHWARHHYAHWYREHFGHEEAAAPEAKDPEAAA
jgi:formate dehydrogenase subunit gamma